MGSGRTWSGRSRLLGLVALLAGCSSGATASAPLAEPPAPYGTPTSVSVAPPLAPPEPEGLPVYFTLELNASGQLFADGTPVVDDGDLTRRARVAAGEVSRAALFGDPRTQELRLVALFELLLRAGFEHVRFGARPAPKNAATSVASPAVAAVARTPAPVPPPSAPQAPANVSPSPPPPSPAPAAAAVAPLTQAFTPTPAAPAPAAPAPRETAPRVAPPPVAAAPAPTPPSPPPVVASPPLPAPAPVRRDSPPVTLQTVGLKVSGSEVDEATRQRIVQLFERQFERFRACYPLAQNRDMNSSFGVDLYVAKEGGAPRVQQTRSRLEGKEFTKCMERAFLGLRFRAPPKGIPQVVSYSVLFKIDS
jgi:hypothetical protein